MYDLLCSVTKEASRNCCPVGKWDFGWPNLTVFPGQWPLIFSSRINPLFSFQALLLSRTPILLGFRNATVTLWLVCVEARIVGTGVRLLSSASNQVPEARDTQELTNANHVALGAGLKPETPDLYTAAPIPHIPPEHPDAMRHMGRGIWATMSQNIVVFDLAAIVEGILALGQALSGTLNSLSREPFFLPTLGFAELPPPTHTHQFWRLHADSLNSFSWCVYILSFVIQTGFLFQTIGKVTTFQA